MARRKKTIVETVELSGTPVQTAALALDGVLATDNDFAQQAPDTLSILASATPRDGGNEQTEAEDDSSSEAPSGPVYVEIRPNGSTNFEDLVHNNTLEIRDGKYYLLCTWGEYFPSLSPVPAKGLTAAPGVAIYRTDKGTETFVITHSESGQGVAVLSHEIAGTDESAGEEIPTLESAYLKVMWLDDVDDSEESSYDDSDSSFATECVVTFSIKEPDGTVQIIQQATFDEGTPMDLVREEFQSTLGSVPVLNSGYWYFMGWSNILNSSETLTSDIISWGQYEPAQVRLAIAANGATTSVAETLVCTWGKMFPDIVPAPKRDEEPCAGLFLTATASGRVITRSHTSEGRGVTLVSSREMGSRTERATVPPTPIDVSSCSLVVHWSEPLAWNTQKDLRDAIGVVPSPFASDPSATVDIPAVYDSSDSEEELCFKYGFPPSYTKPLIDPKTGKVNADARVITRRQVNTLGYIGTQEQFFEQCGGYHTFDQAVCDAIGGYPESAVLKYFDEGSNCLRTVYSLLDDNNWNFLENGVDGIHWKYVDSNPVVNLKVDYSDFIDLRDILFVETGLPEFYELPFDGYLQLHALSFCDMGSTLRNQDQEYAREVSSISQRLVQNGVLETWEALPNYENVNGALETEFKGTVYLDVYNAKTNTTNSLYIRLDGNIGTHVSVWQATPLGPNGAYYQYKCPFYVVTQGGFFLNKGDKIRIRGSYTDQLATMEYWEGGETNSLGDASRVAGKVLTDKEVRRCYLTKFANFYRVGWEG